MLTADRAVCVNVSPIAVLTRDQIQATSKEIRCTLASSTTCSKRTNTCSLNRAHTDGPCMTLTTCSSISPMPVSIFAKSQDDGRCAGAHRRPPNTHHANTTRVHRRAQKPRKNSNVPCLARSSMSMCMHDQVSRMLCGARLQNAVRSTSPECCAVRAHSLHSTGCLMHEHAACWAAVLPPASALLREGCLSRCQQPSQLAWTQAPPAAHAGS